MSEHLRGILQLDFDGTLALDDVSVGILSHFAGPEWRERVECAGRELLTDPSSTGLVDTMVEGYAGLRGQRDEYLQYARRCHPARPGIKRLVDTALELGLECHVVSNGFEFYIRDYLHSAAPAESVEVHAGHELADGTLVYLGPDGRPVRARFKESWARHFRERHDLLIYVGDGSSDVPPAQLASIVFARDGLLAHMPSRTGITLRPFDALDDIANELVGLLR